MQDFLFFVYVYMIRISAVNHSLDHEGHEVTVELHKSRSVTIVSLMHTKAQFRREKSAHYMFLFKLLAGRHDG